MSPPSMTFNLCHIPSIGLAEDSYEVEDPGRIAGTFRLEEGLSLCKMPLIVWGWCCSRLCVVECHSVPLFVDFWWSGKISWENEHHGAVVGVSWPSIECILLPCPCSGHY